MVTFQIKRWRPVGLYQSIVNNGKSRHHMQDCFSLVFSHVDAFIYLYISGFNVAKKYETSCSAYGRERVRSFSSDWEQRKLRWTCCLHVSSHRIATCSTELAVYCYYQMIEVVNSFFVKNAFCGQAITLFTTIIYHMSPLNYQIHCCEELYDRLKWTSENL